MKRFACLIAILAALTPQLGAPTSATTTTEAATAAAFDNFVGRWYGHTRLLRIRSDHVAREVIYSGCCTKVAVIRYRITNARGDRQDGVLRARALRVRIFESGLPRTPHRGDVRRITVNRGEFLNRHTGINYCTPAAGRRGVCGA